MLVYVHFDIKNLSKSNVFRNSVLGTLLALFFQRDPKNMILGAPFGPSSAQDGAPHLGPIFDAAWSAPGHILDGFYLLLKDCRLILIDLESMFAIASLVQF